MKKIREIETAKTFANNLKRIMLSQNITGAKMSQDLSINKSSISQWMNGLNFPSPDTLSRIANYLGVTIDDLYGRSIEKQIYTPPEQIETYQEAIDFLSSLNLLRAYGGLDVNSKSEEDIINLARTIHSVLKMQGAFKK